MLYLYLYLYHSSLLVYSMLVLDKDTHLPPTLIHRTLYAGYA